MAEKTSFSALRLSHPNSYQENHIITCSAKKGDDMRLFGPPRIEKLKAKRNIAGLRKTLSSRYSWEMRLDAALALAELGDDQGTQEFAKHLSGLELGMKDSMDAAQALEAAGERAVSLLAAILSNPDNVTTSHSGAASILALIGGDRSQDALMDVFEQRRANENTDFRMENASKALQKIGSERIVDRLLNHVNGRREDLEEQSRKIQAIFILGVIGSGRAVEPLMYELSDEDGDYNPWSKERTRKISRAAAIALGGIADPRAVDSLIDVLKWRGKHHEVYQCARNALVKMGQNAIQPLVAAIGNADNSIRIGAASALGEMGRRDAVPVLIEVLQGPDAHAKGRHAEADWLVAEVACSAIANIGDPSAVPALKALVEDDSATSRVRKAAEEALKALS